ncbi:hypothetical protein PQG02_28985 [Nostoc sp. UHCC 0926]|uniref:hypothetical protein n=1 Tax=unclassified Nostoc TaxID=2593658 RepID=UPI00236069EE|nr:hypothetical protein [Nostoc sp. UHCC 0926]WDD32637.1 hypothetical protein PQG02_28985 [Nostoc sp. UHCC 0926]
MSRKLAIALEKKCKPTSDRVKGVADKELTKKRADALTARHLHTLRPEYAKLGFGLDRAEDKASQRVEELKAKIKDKILMAKAIHLGAWLLLGCIASSSVAWLGALHPALFWVMWVVYIMSGASLCLALLQPWLSTGETARIRQWLTAIAIPKPLLTEGILHLLRHTNSV